MVTILPLATSSAVTLKGEYQLFSSHDKAVNLIGDSGQLVSLHPSVKVMSPFGIVMRRDDFHYVRSQCHEAERIKTSAFTTLMLPDCTIIPACRKVTLKVKPDQRGFSDLQVFFHLANRKNGFGYSNAHTLAHRLSPIHSLIDYIHTPTLNSARRVVQHIGRGQGLTPSFDDALIGALAVLYWREKHPTYLPSLISALAEVELGQLTTRVSKSFIEHAVQGEVSYPLYRLLASFRHSELTVQKAIAQFLRHGHTSGTDTLLGTAIAFQHIH